MLCACAILSAIACAAVPYFSSLSHKRHYFRGGGELLNTKACDLIFSKTLVENFIILRRIQRDMIKKCALTFM